MISLCVVRRGMQLEKLTSRLSERLAYLGKMMAPLRPLKYHSAKMFEGFQGTSIGCPRCRETLVSRTDVEAFLV